MPKILQRRGTKPCYEQDEVLLNSSNINDPRRYEEHVCEHAMDDQIESYWDSYFQGYIPKAFPSLIGLRFDVLSGLTGSASIRSSVSLPELENGARLCGASSLAVMEAGWGSVLQTYHGFNDVVFGTALVECGENDSEHYFARELVLLPVRLQPNLQGMDFPCTNAELLRKLAQEHTKSSTFPYSLIGPQLERGKKHCFDTAIILRTSVQCELEGGTMDLYLKSNNLIVIIEVSADTNASLRLTATFKSEYLDEWSAKMMLEQLDDVLKWIVSNPTEDYGNAFANVKPTLQSCMNVNPMIDPRQNAYLPFIHSQFEIHAIDHPSDIALIMINEIQNEQSPLNIQWTYAMLNDKAEDLADHLIANYGPFAGSPIPIYMEKSPYLYLTILGILKAGGAWCPIDTLSPAMRRRELIARTEASILIIAQPPSEIDSQSLPEGVMPVDVREVKPRALLHGPSAPTASRKTPAKPHDMAYLIWTSGTTGPPKGVSISHEAAVTSMRAIQSRISSETRNGGPVRCLQFSQHTFDVFVQDCFYTWGRGGILISATREIMIGAFAKLANSTRATHAHLTPAFAAGIPRASCKTLEVVTMIGEKLPQHVADDWGRNMLAYNTYGPAEVTVVSTVKQFGGDEKMVKSSNIGYPLPSVSCYVLRGDRPTLINGIGELALGGYQLSKGYWKDPQKTSQRFVRNEATGKDLYITGDIVRQLADGTLEFIGRDDDLVKVGGIRVELSEISYALRKSHPSVDQIETFYIGRSDRPAKIIVSFIAASGLEVESPDHGFLLTSDNSAEIAAAALKTGRQSLPEYMAPNIVVVVKCIPRTPSAKVDRKALFSAYECLDLGAWELKTNVHHTIGSLQTSYTETENAVLDIVSAISGVLLENMNRTSHLPALGIDSLLSGRLASEVQKLGYKVSLESVLQSRTVEDLLQLTTGKRSRTMNNGDATFDALEFHNQWSPLVMKSIGRSNLLILPASILQDGLLSESMADHKSYWSNHFFTLPSETNFEKLHAAWKDVQRQNQALRTGFHPVAAFGQLTRSLKCSSNFLQLIYDEADVEYRYIHAPERDCEEIALACAFEITQKHNQESFIDPPWAIHIISSRSSLTMMLSIHHAIHDDTSLGFIVKDVWDVYTGKAMNQRRQLHDAISVMLASSANKNRESEAWYNNLRLFADPDACSWPDLTGRRELLNEDNKRALVSISYKMQSLRQDIQHVLQTLAVTPISMIRTAFGCLILDYLETDKVVFGETLSERIFYPDLADAIAPMLSVIPVPLRRQGTGLEMIRELDKSIQLARSRRGTPATVIKGMLKRSRVQPLYPAIFSFNPAELQCVLDGDSDLWPKSEDVVGLSVEHPFALNVTNDRGWNLELVAENTFMNQEHLQIFAVQIDALVQAMIQSPRAPIAGLLDAHPGNILSMTRSNLPSSIFPLSTLYPTYWVQHYAEYHPEWNAVEVTEKIDIHGATTQSWTYAQLEKESNRIATYIRTAGHRDRIIAMCCGRTLVSFAVILGILKSGNTYLPIDESLPAKRRLLLLADSRCSMLFTDSYCVQSFDIVPDACLVVNLDDARKTQALGSLSSDHGTNFISPGSSAYLLYTSGSTGKPKGVLISHRNLCVFVEGLSAFMRQCLPATHRKGGTGKWLALASRAFDVHLCETFIGWRLGLTVSTAPREVLLDNLKLALKILKITHACFVPSLLDQAGIEPHHVPDLVYFSVGGEKVSKKVLDTWDKQDNTLVLNAYGPTEMTIGCTASRISAELNARNIGRPFGNTGAHVLLSGTHFYAKRGQSGELCLTGDLVGNGYFERPDATGYVSDFNGERMYRTGDIVRMMADGSLEYLGRSDDQTKIRGQRIELGEVSESVRTCFVKAIDVTTLIVCHPELAKNLLVSFVSNSTERSVRYGVQPSVLQENLHTFGTHVQAECRKRLPTYMVPDYIIPIDVVPLAQTSGKADAKTLKALFSSIPLSNLLGLLKSSDSNIDEPRILTEAERKVVESIRSVVDIQASLIQHDSNIFQLGIDSLKVVGLSIELRKSGFTASVTSVLTNPTVQGLALLPIADIRTDSGSTDCTELSKRLLNIEADAYKKAALKINQSLIQSIRPCLPLQEGIIARTYNSGSKGHYIYHMVFELKNELELGRFKQAWSDVFKDTAILRTCFQQVEDSILQIILKPNAVALPWIESGQDHGHRTFEVLQAEQKRMGQNLVDLMEIIPPIRLQLAISKAHPSLLSVSIHHALYDGISFDMILNDIYLRYCRKPRKDRASFDILLGYVASQRQSEQESFWIKRLSSYRRTTLSEVHTDKIQQNTIERIMKVTFLESQALSASLKVTVQTLLQTLYGALLARFVGQRDVLFGVILSGRTGTVDAAETILAPCITTVPQRLRFGSNSTALSSVVTGLQQSNIELLPFQHTSLRKINQWLGAEKPLFDSLFSYIQRAERPLYESLWREVESTMTLDYPFAIEFEPDEEADRMIARVAFTSSFGPQEKAHAMLEQIDLLLTTLNNGENITVNDIQIHDREVSEQSLKTVWDEANWMPEEDIIKNIATAFCKVDSSLITKNTSFFSLGIDSITAIQFARSLRDARIEVKSSDVLRYPSIGALWNHLNPDKQAVIEEFTKSNEATPIQQSNILPFNKDTETTYLCTPLQTGMITATLSSDGSLYVHHHAVRLSPKVNIAKLKRAWELLVQSNDILRTTFHAVAEGQNPWIACVYRSPQIRWHEMALETSIDDFIENIGKGMVYHNEVDFQEPPVQVYIFHTFTESVLVVSMHHALYDGLSIPMIFDELANLYLSGIPRSRLSYYTAAKSLHSSEVRSIGFWIENLQDYLPLGSPPIPSVRPRGMIHAEKPMSLDILNVKGTCKLLGVTVQTLSLLAYGKILSCHLGRRDVVFGHVVAGRSLPLDGIEDVIGPLFNTVPFRIRFNQPLQSNRGMAADIQRFTSASIPFQHASMQLIQNAWRRQNHGSDVSLFDTLFLFQKDTSTHRSADELWEQLGFSGEFNRSDYRLNFEVIEDSEHMTIRASCHEEHMSKDGLLNLIELLDAVFQDIIDHPSRSVLAFPEGLSPTPLIIKQESCSEPRVDVSLDIEDGGMFVEALRHIISEVSAVPVGKIGPDTSIYSIGLDSIKAIRLASKCRDRGLHVSVANVLQGVTPRKISNLIYKSVDHHKIDEVKSDLGPKYNDLCLSNIDKRNVDAILPCLGGQTYHLICWLNSGRTMLEPTWAYETEKLDLGRLEKAWAQLQIRHYILRTTYIAISASEAAQVILKPSTVTSTKLNVIQSKLDFEETVKRRIGFEAKNPSNMSTVPARLCLIQGKDHDAILFTLHHASYDAWTMPLLISDLAAIYAGFDLGPTPDFSIFVKYSIHTLRSLDQKSFWQDMLKDAQPTLLNPQQSFSALTHSTATLSNFRPQKFLLLPFLVPNLSRLATLAKTHDITLQTFLLLAFARLLARHTNTTNPTFGMYQLARSATFKDIQRLTGPCLNVTPLSVKDPLGASSSELSSTTTTAAIASAKFIQRDLARRVPYEQSYLNEILECVSMGRGVLFDTYINILFDPPPSSKSNSTSSSEDSSSPTPTTNPHPTTLNHHRPNTAPPPRFTPLHLGPPTDFASTERIPGETAVDGLAWPLMSKGGLFLDVLVRRRGSGYGSGKASSRAEVVVGGNNGDGGADAEDGNGDGMRVESGGEGGWLDIGARGEGEGWDRGVLEGIARGFAAEVEALGRLF